MSFKEALLSKAANQERLASVGRWSMENVFMPSLMVGVFMTAALLMAAIGLWNYALAWLTWAIDCLGVSIRDSLEKGRWEMSFG